MNDLRFRKTWKKFIGFFFFKNNCFNFIFKLKLNYLTRNPALDNIYPCSRFNNKWIQEMGLVSIHENGNITRKTIEKQQKPIY